ncbi:MAG: hypothetical protein JJ891_06885 [Rhizobiaceae bacterium]|nr:hypothetical protein [Rhizobiaceae bacterium]
MLDTEDKHSEFSLGMSAEDFYNAERGGRTGAVAVARRISDITIPSVFPPEHWRTGDQAAITNQSVNARLVNGLASNLMLSALPPGLPMAEYVPEEHELAEEIEQDPALWGKVKYALSRREQTYRANMELTKARSTYVRIMRKLIIAGNCLAEWMEKDSPQYHSMHNYVVKRASNGDPLVTVLKVEVSMATLEDDLKEAVLASRRASGDVVHGKNEWEDSATIYKVMKLSTNDDDEMEWVCWQEIGGKYIPDTESYHPYDVPPYFPAWLVPDEHGDWGTPYCGDYEGDLLAVENFGSALQDGAADAAFSLILVDPEGVTDMRDVKEAENLSVISGREKDLTRTRAQKGGDHQVTASEFDKAARRLGFAFMSATSIQRDAERVTQEEWQRLSMELDKAMGGVYSELSQSFQKWFVLRFIFLCDEEKGDTLPPLPEGLVKLTVKTGIDNIGHSSDYVKLQEFAAAGQKAYGPEVFARSTNPHDFFLRLAAAKGIKSEGLIKSPDQMNQEIQAEREQGLQQKMLEQATPALAKEGAGAIREMAQQQGNTDE